MDLSLFGSVNRQRREARRQEAKSPCYATRYLNDEQTLSFSFYYDDAKNLLMNNLCTQPFLLKPLIVALWLVAINRYQFLIVSGNHKTC